jgi:beta-alanine degradation protein BauB
VSVSVSVFVVVFVLVQSGSIVGSVHVELTGGLMTRARVVACVVPAVLLLGGVLSGSQDRAAAVPEMKVLLQNERVRVQYHDVAVGETTPMHSHPAYVAYVFNPYVGKAVLADGTEVMLARKPGDVFYSGPVTHRIVNTGTTPIHNLIVELKDAAK